jgi:hypothetical protein
VSKTEARLITVGTILGVMLILVSVFGVLREKEMAELKKGVSSTQPYIFQTVKISNPMTFESYFYEKGALCSVSVEEHGYTIAYPDGRTVRVYGDVVAVIEKKEEREKK